MKKLLITAVLVTLPLTAQAGGDRDIKRYCKAEWPGDRGMQKYCYSKQKKYYDRGRKIEKTNHSSRPAVQKWRGCERQYAPDYQMVNICYNKS